MSGPCIGLKTGTRDGCFPGGDLRQGLFPINMAERTPSTPRSRRCGRAQPRGQPSGRTRFLDDDQSGAAAPTRMERLRDLASM